MNKYFLYAASVLALASCSSDDFLGENSGNVQNAANSVINFGGETGKITRAADGTSVGATAADLLGGKFYVLGTKGSLPKTNPTETIVFDNYQVNWEGNTAGTTADNTNDWKYVGITPTGLHAGDKEITAQSIKFWDYSQPHYDFIAYSVGSNILATSGDPVDGTIVGTAIKTPKANTVKAEDYLSYSLTGKKITDLQKCYYTDVTPVEKADYQKPVKFTFKNLTAKVRVAFYETIPGYTVSGIEFYDNGTDKKDNLTGKDEAVLYTTNETKLSTNGTINVTYPKVGSDNANDAAFNKAFVSIVTGTDDQTTKLGLGTVNYNDKKVLNDNAKDANMAGKKENSYFTAVLPAEGHALTLRLNYTLTSTDGSGEKIKVYGATAVIPASYTAWQPNYAYTYIFKISDNTNGATSKEDGTPEGLFPITFDAVVADVDNADFSHESITTVATPSVTTYAFNSHDKKVIKAYGVGNEYPAATTTDIYFSVSEDGKTMNDLNSKGQLYSVSKADATEATVIDALQIRASEDENTVKGRNDIVLTKVGTTIVNEIPKEDGKTIKVGDNTTAKFTASETATTYAYVYRKEAGKSSAIYTAITIGEGTTIIAGEDEYYENPSGNTAVANGTTLTVGTTYYKKYTNNNNVYGVKVVKTYK